MGMDVSEMFGALRDAVRDRVSNPVFNTFALSWIFVNYRIFFTLFSGRSPAWKFEYIDTVLYPGWKERIGLLIALPAFFAFFYLFAVPWGTRPIYRRAYKLQMDLVKDMKENDGAEILTREEAGEITLAAKKDVERADLGKYESDTKLKEANLTMRQVKADAENRELEAEKKVGIARLETGRVEKTLVDLRRELIVERAVSSYAAKYDDWHEKMGAYLTSRKFLLRYRFEGKLVPSEVEFEEGGALIGQSIPYKSWNFVDWDLVLSHEDGSKIIRLGFRPRERDFEGVRGSGGIADMSPIDP